MATATSEKSSTLGSQRRSKRLLPGQSTNTPRDHQPPRRQGKSRRQNKSDNSIRRLYQLVETVIARVEVLEKSDEKDAYAERPRPGSSDGTTHVRGKDGDREIYKMLEATIARVSILEGRRDIRYHNAFKATGGAGCIVRGCGTKSSSSSFKNDVRHFKTTSTPEHEIAAILLQQKQCLQCGEQWKTWFGLDHHERAVHQETHSSRIETFLPYLKQPLSCIPECQSTQSPPPVPDSLQPNMADPNPPNWSISNNFQPLADSTPADLPLHPLQPAAESLPTQLCNDLQPNWSSSNDFQPWERSSSAYPSMQPLHQRYMPAAGAPHQPEWSQSEYFQQSVTTTEDHAARPSEFINPQPSWSGSNDFGHPGHY